jgi:hypothetical protein
MKSIFLSASIPLPGREYYGTANPLMIHAAVRAFLALILGRRHLVWGGHPSITPMVSAACDSLGLQYLDAVTLYQSRAFVKDFPKENDRFGNLILTSEGADRESSLSKLRNTMLSSHEFDGAVFIGGMSGVIEEYRLFTQIHPDAPALTLYRPGAAAADLAVQLGYDETLDAMPTDFTNMYINVLGVLPTEPRLTTLNREK